MDTLNAALSDAKARKLQREKVLEDAVRRMHKAGDSPKVMAERLSKTSNVIYDLHKRLGLTPHDDSLHLGHGGQLRLRAGGRKLRGTAARAELARRAASR
jgi:hypothetical protein